MTIEKSPAPSGAKPASTSDVKHGKGKPSEAGPAGAGGFMDILAALDASATLATDTVLQPEPEDALALALPEPAVPLAVDMTAADVKSDAVVDPATFFAQSMQWTTAAPDAVADAVVAQLPVTASPVAGAALARPATGPAHAAPVQTLPMEPASSSDGARKPTKAKAGPLSEQAPFGAALANPNQSAGSGQSETRATQLLQKNEAAQMAPIAIATALASTTVAASRDESARDRTIFKPIAAEAPPPPQPVGAGTPASPLQNASGVPVSPEVYVAEQVKYWISNDVQNAEMMLDGLGKNPVEVSISLQGNEAHVSFRTDESQARDVLESASRELKDMMQREGLVLSGVSVGSSGPGDSGQQDRRPRQGARQATIPVIQPFAADLRPGSSPASGRALDLFV